MIQALRIAGTVALVLVALVSGSTIMGALPAGGVIVQGVFAVCVHALGYLVRSAVQEHRDRGRQ